MDYFTHYHKLVERARHRQIEGYSEKHHVKPRCLGGDDSPDNLVRLTPEEHYVAHQLLVKMYPGHKGLIWAAMAMTNATGGMVRNNKMYGWLRRRFAEEMRRAHTGRKASPEARAKMSAARKGKKRKPHTAETKAKMSATARGRPKSAAHRKALSKAKTGKKLGPQTAEHREKIRQSNIEAAKHRDKSWMQTEEYKTARSEQMKRVWAERQKGQ